VLATHPSGNEIADECAGTRGVGSGQAIERKVAVCAPLAVAAQAKIGIASVFRRVVVGVLKEGATHGTPFIALP